MDSFCLTLEEEYEGSFIDFHKAFVLGSSGGDADAGKPFARKGRRRTHRGLAAGLYGGAGICLEHGLAIVEDCRSTHWRRSKANAWGTGRADGGITADPADSHKYFCEGFWCDCIGLSSLLRKGGVLADPYEFTVKDIFRFYWEGG